MPARPHSGGDTYGWGDWFVASLLGSLAAWPAVFAADMLWGDVLLPATEGSDGYLAPAIAIASLVPKAAGSYLGAHMYVPRAWWLYKLTLLPALPVSFAFSLAIHAGTSEGAAAVAADRLGSAGPEVPFPPSASSSRIVSSAWQPSSSERKSAATRLRHAAPSPVQLALQRAGL